MKIKIVTVCHLYFLFALLLLGLADYMDMRGMEHGVDAPSFIFIFKAFVFAVWFGSMIKLAFPAYKLYLFPLPLMLYLVFYLWSYIPTMLTGNMPLTQIVNNLITILTPLMVLLSAYNTAIQTDNDKWDKGVILFIFILFVLQYISIFKELSFFGMAHLVCSYYTLLILPLILLFKSRIIKIGLIFIVILILFSSMKRAGILALAFALFFYIFVSQYVRNKFNIVSFIGSIILILVIGGTFVFLGTSDSENENIFERFENIDRDNGSGRLVVWTITATMISKQDVGGLIFGNGYGTVERDSQLQWSAHNDFLEVTYDYGIIGLILYLGALVSLTLYVMKMTLARSPYAPPMVLLLVFYLILSMISHIIIYYWSNLVMLTIGYMIGKYRKDAVNTQNHLQ